MRRRHVIAAIDAGVNASGGGGNGFAAPDLWDHDYEDQTEGGLVTGGGTPIFETSQWSLVDAGAGGAAKSTRYYALHTFPQSAGNVGTDAYTPAFTNRTWAYARFYLGFSVGKPPEDVLKVLRFHDGGFSGPFAGTLTIDGNLTPKRLAWFWDWTGDLTLAANENTPAPDGDDLADGVWHLFELFNDITDTNDMSFWMKVDGTRYFNYANQSTGAGAEEFGRALWLPLVNSAPSADLLVAMDEAAVSTQEIGP